MQTQWSTGANDGNGGGGFGGDPTTAGREGATGGAGAQDAMTPEDAATPAEATAPDGSPSASAGPEAAGDGTEGEEEAHRSAVDAVDGLLDEVELALARLDDGTYGRCEECGAPIDDARLAVSPIERACGRCVIGGGGPVGAVDAVSGVDVARSPVAPVGLSAATGHHGG